MARHFWKVGTNSGNNGCPTLYSQQGGDTYVVHGDPVTDRAELAQLDFADGESAVTIPRELLANFGPNERVHVPHPISFDEFDGIFTALRNSAWRLETRRRYAWDEQQGTYLQLLAEGRVDWDLNDPWCQERREQTALGKKLGRAETITRRSGGGSGRARPGARVRRLV
ncbi:hypothetical protein O3S80_20630 [Streptomyces sp. Lzd4kr]|nr:hypothetical protein [Streptomyces sp. Lzd4kr]